MKLVAQQDGNEEKKKFGCLKRLSCRQHSWKRDQGVTILLGDQGEAKL